jgi:hypothetical protein
MTGSDGSSTTEVVYLFLKFTITKNVNANDPAVVFGTVYSCDTSYPVNFTWGDSTSSSCTGPPGSQPGLFHGYQNIAYPITANASCNGGLALAPVTFKLPVTSIARVYFSGTYGAQFLNVSVSSTYIGGLGGGFVSVTGQFYDQYNNLLSILNLPTNVPVNTGLYTTQIDLTQMATHYGPTGGPYSITTLVNSLKCTIYYLGTPYNLPFPNYNLNGGTYPTSILNDAVSYM